VSAGRPGTPQGSRPPAPRPHFTGRAAILAIVLCGIALSLAYPVREYISQRKQIDQLLAQRNAIMMHRERLEAEHKRLKTPTYIEQQARDRLHMCLPTQMCYEIIGGAHKKVSVARQVAASPWYGRLWSSIRQADTPPPTPSPAQPPGDHAPAKRAHQTGQAHHAKRVHKARHG
jgi:cell division protein FtsB